MRKQHGDRLGMLVIFCMDFSYLSACHARWFRFIFFVLITIISIYLPSSLYHHLCTIIYVPSVYHHLSTSIYLSLYLAISLSIYLSTYLSLFLSIYLLISLSIYLSIYLPIYLSIYLSFYLSTCHYPSTFLPFYILIWVSDPPTTHGLRAHYPMPWHCTSLHQSKNSLISSLQHYSAPLQAVILCTCFFTMSAT